MSYCLDFSSFISGLMRCTVCICRFRRKWYFMIDSPCTYWLYICNQAQRQNIFRARDYRSHDHYKDPEGCQGRCQPDRSKEVIRLGRGSQGLALHLKRFTLSYIWPYCITHCINPVIFKTRASSTWLSKAPGSPAASSSTMDYHSWVSSLVTVL